MPVEKPHIPPERKPVAEYQTPSPAVVFYTELVNRTDPAYVQNAPVKRGTLYSSIVGANQDVIATYPNLYFVKERKHGLSDQLVFWDWATVPDAEDTYNAEATYVSNAVAYPAFTRVYTIRRDEYEQSPTLAIGTTLTALLGVTITNGGLGYTTATGTIAGTDVEIEFVISNGVIISGVIVNEGTGITVNSVITISGDGLGALAAPIVQGTTCYLTSQKKQELPEGDPLRNEFVRVIRTYETLPGPFIATTRIDDDGKVVTINTRRNIAANIVSAETLVGGSWCKATKKGDDNFVGEESVECRDVPGNPVVSTRVEEDGKILTVTKTLKDTTTITSQEQVTGGNWVRTYKEEVSDLVANEIVESRPVPGNAIPYTRVDDDGKTVTGTRTLKESSTIVTTETLIGGTWTHTSKEKVSDLVSWEVTESRPIPGNAVPSSRIDTDGVKVDIVTTLKDTTAITTQETLVGGVWTRTTKKEVSDLVAQEIVETRDIPGNGILETSINKDGDITSITRTLVEASTLATTNVIIGGVWTRTYEVPLNGSKLVATKTVEVRNTQNELPFYSVEIPNLIPQEFRAFIPTTTTETTEIGTASLPTLGVGDLFRSERQLDDYTFRRTITGFGGITLPQTHCNKETTEVFGGGVLNTCITLELVGTGTIDQGLLVVRSSITDLGNGMEIKLTSSLDDTAWPILYGTHIDTKYLIEVDLQKQTVAAGTTGGVLPDGTIVEVNPHDKWRSIQISSKLNADTLPEDTQWFSGQNHSFPPELTDSVIQWAFAECGCSFSFSAMLQANMLQYTGAVKTRITEQFYNGAPPDDVTITQFFPQAHNFGFAWASACGDTDGNCRTKSGAPLFHIPLCLHDDLALSVGANTWTFAATSPAALPHGDYIMLPPHVERWRFGVFRRLLIEVLVP